MRKLSTLYTILQEAFIIFRSSSICVELVWIINAKKVTKEESDFLREDFAKFKPEGKQKGELWFETREQRLGFLQNRISTLKSQDL